MDGLNNIFGQPTYLGGVGNIYPVKIKDYEKFSKYRGIISVPKMIEDNGISLLEILFASYDILGFESSMDLMKHLMEAFSFFLQTDDVENIGKINSTNYEEFRKIVMRQNLIFEPKIYKDKLTQEWANMVLEARSKKGIKILFEDMITTVKNHNGYTYDEMKEFTIYQLYADFYRISKDKNFAQSSLFATVSTEKISIQHFAEYIDMYKSPYDDLFVGSDKLNKLNQAMQKTK